MKFFRITRSWTGLAGIFSTISFCTASSSAFFSSPRTRRTKRRSLCCSRLALIVEWVFWSLGGGGEKHAEDGEEEDGQAEERGGNPNPRLLEFASGPGEEEHGGKQNGVGQISAGKTSRVTRPLEPLHGF